MGEWSVHTALGVHHRNDQRPDRWEVMGQGDLDSIGLELGLGLGTGWRFGTAEVWLSAYMHCPVGKWVLNCSTLLAPL
jgi:hypothetical protein